MKSTPAFLGARTGGAAVEVGGMANVIDGFRIEIAVFAHGQDLRHRHVAEIATRIGQRREQAGRLADGSGHDDGVTVLDDTNGVGGGHAFLLV